MYNRLDHVWFVSAIWFHVSIKIFQLFRIHFDLLCRLKERRTGTFQNRSRHYYCDSQAEMKNVVSLTSRPFVKYSETLVNHRKKFSFLVCKHLQLHNGTEFFEI